MYLFKKTVCVLISGKAGVGKTTLANMLKEILIEEDLKAEKFSFATGVKQAAQFIGWDKNKDDKGRQLLINVGMAGREYDKDTWCKTTFKYIIPDSKGYPFDFVLIDDLRFENEVDYVKNDWTYQTFVVRIEAPERECLKNTLQYNDESETSMPSAPNEIYDFVIDNTGSLEELKEKAKELAKAIIDKTEKV